MLEVLLLILLPAWLHGQASKSEISSGDAHCKLPGGNTVRTAYAAPRAQGRKIFGGLVPYGEVWVPGTTQAPTFITDADLSVGGEDVSAGSYHLFVIPRADRWTLIISKKTVEPAKGYVKSDDLLRVDMQLSKTPEPIETFTIAYQPKAGACTLTMSWENVLASVDVAEKKLCWPTTTPLTYQCPDQ